MEVAGVSRTPVSVLPAAAAELKSALKPEAEGERPRCSSTPCSPIRGTVSGYQILHMDSSYLVGFATGEELLKAARKRPGGEPAAAAAETSPGPRAKPPDQALHHRAARVYKTKSRYYQPYEVPAGGGGGGWRRRQVSGPGERRLAAPASAPDPRGPLPRCLLRARRPHSKSLDYLNLDKMSVSARERPADTDVLQRQLQHLTLRAERAFARDKT